LIVCVVVMRPLLIERCVELKEGSGVERPCAMIFTLLSAQPITTVSLTTNTCMMNAIAHAHLAPWTSGSNLAVRVNRAIDDWPGIQQEAICYQWFKQRLILSISTTSISQRSQIKEDTIEPSVPAREFNLKALTHYDLANLGLKPRLADNLSQAVCTAMLPTAPLGQANYGSILLILF